MTSKEILEAVLSKTISIQEAKALLEADFKKFSGNDRVLTNAVGKALIDLAKKGSDGAHSYVLDCLDTGMVDELSLDEIGYMIIS